MLPFLHLELNTQHDLMVSSSLQFIIFQVVYTQRWKKLGCLLSPIYFNTTLAMCIDDDVVMTLMTMVTQHIPTMTKSHHGGELSVMMKVGMCQCQKPTIHHDELYFGVYMYIR